MRILILGGTIFVGPHLIDAAHAAGHSVTIFHRGRHPFAPRDGVEVIVGDRTNAADLAALAERGRAGGGTWDAVIDTCGYLPRVVRASALALRESARCYVFISSLSALADTFGPGDEDAGTAPRLAVEPTAMTGETYGALKAGCEDAVRDVFGDGAVIVRPGYIVGPLDPSDRYTYWIRRIARGGDVLAPGDGSRKLQFVHARDLADFTVSLATRVAAMVPSAATPTAPRTFHVTGHSLRFDAFLAGVASACGTAPTIRWVPEDVLLANAANGWTNLPIWSPGEDHVSRIDRALAAGLSLRDPVATAADTLVWDRSRDASRPLVAGMDAALESEILGRG